MACGGGAIKVSAAVQSATEVGTSPLRAFVLEKFKTQQRVKLDLYVMSQCPYGVLAEQTVVPRVREFGERLDFNLHFIAAEDDGCASGFSSLHGQREVDEDIRQLVMLQEHPGQFVDYILARRDDGDRRSGTRVSRDCQLQTG